MICMTFIGVSLPWAPINPSCQFWCYSKRAVESTDVGRAWRIPLEFAEDADEALLDRIEAEGLHDVAVHPGANGVDHAIFRDFAGQHDEGRGGERGGAAHAAQQ